ncbi:MAG: Lrp/AsnC family transcriptional regulator [Nanoarchaeota archaeon]|nr:Lrp/AsnC family transcriptional regulator [Nanoarchaeota archaeon]
MNKDLLILHHLRHNGRETLTKISRITGIPVSTIFDRLQTNLNNTILRPTVLLNYEHLGYRTRIQAVLRVNKDQREEAKTFLVQHLNINTCYKINNGYHYLIEAIFKDLPGVELFIEELEQHFTVEEKKIFYILEELKREGFLAESKLLPRS